ncbi:hypothetical protein C8F04DRAFT_1142641 [Mycena alexandri]|uniref:Uncharacterized protein n=1 Tax=Mycena alexandri TaxID=1745969 RepID=A0AAD6S4U1_9AGAR|nr:hypothetical protein C8F04DRAFT_1142641 [Mycena alexandri]
MPPTFTSLLLLLESDIVLVNAPPGHTTISVPGSLLPSTSNLYTGGAARTLLTLCLLQLPLVSPFLSVWDWRCVYAHPLLAYTMVPHSVACAERSALIRDRGEGAAHTSPPSHFVWSPYAVGPTALIIFCSRVRA